MNEILLYSLLVLGVLGGILAIILYVVAQKFKVKENPLIDEVESGLAGANCGACGFAGCRNFAEACVKAAEEKGSLEGLNCVSSDMTKIAAILHLNAVIAEPKIAVIRCNGSYTNVSSKVHYEGVDICAFANTLYAGENACPNGCLGLGDCVKKCVFDALHIDKTTGLPVVDENKCVGCGACVKGCPRSIIELRPRGKKNRRIYVGCINTEKGAITMKNCKVGCIGCQKCFKVCSFGAIEMRGNLAYINPEKCRQCRKCVEICPRGCIYEVNFPPRKPKEAKTELINNESKE